MKRIKLFLAVAFAIFGLQTLAFEYDYYDVMIKDKDPIGEYAGHPLYSASVNETVTFVHPNRVSFVPVEINGRIVRNYNTSYTYAFRYTFTTEDIPSTNIYAEIKLYSGTGNEFCCYAMIPTNNSNQPSHQSIVLGISATSVTRWECSNDGGITWENIECVDFAYLEEDPEEGTVMYRILQTDGTYSEILTINYYDVVPSEIVASPATIS